MKNHTALVAPALLALAVLAPRGLAQCEEAKLVASDGTEGDRVGWAVSICGDTALMGAYTDDDAGVGDVYYMGPFPVARDDVRIPLQPR